jgi:hypothetical protein
MIEFTGTSLQLQSIITAQTLICMSFEKSLMNLWLSSTTPQIHESLLLQPLCCPNKSHSSRTVNSSSVILFHPLPRNACQSQGNALIYTRIFVVMCYGSNNNQNYFCIVWILAPYISILCRGRSFPFFCFSFQACLIGWARSSKSLM